MRTIFKVLCALGIVAGMLFQPVFATALEDGRKAYLAENYKKAKKILMPLAREGDAKAQELIAIMYDFGHGLDKNQAEAITWYEKSAAQGNVTLQHDLGIRYFKGDRVQQDYGKAAFWWRKAAEAGVAESQYNLGLMLTQALGLEKDPVEAVAWYEKAAGQNHPNAQYSLGIAYAFGQGVEVDYEKALTFFTMAARNGIVQAQYNLGVLYENGRGTDVNREQAEYWFKKAANKGLAEAKQKVAQLEPVEVKPSPGVAAEFKTAGSSAASVTPPVQSNVPVGDSAALVKQLSTQLQEERGKVASLSSEVTNNLLEIERLQQRAQERSAEDTQQDLRISGLETDLNTARANATELQRKLDAQIIEENRLTGLLEAADAEQQRLQQALTGREAQMAGMQGEIDSLKQDLQVSASLGEEQQKLRQDYASVDSSRKQLEQDLVDARTVITDLRAQLESNEQKVMEKLAEVERMEAAASEGASKETEMALKLETFTEQLGAYRTQVAALNNQLAEKEAKERDMRSEINSLTAARVAAESSLSVAKATSDKLKLEVAGIGALTGSKEKAQREVDVLNRKLETATTENRKLEADLAGARASVTELQGMLESASEGGEDLGRQVAAISRERDALKSQLDVRDVEAVDLREQVARLRVIADRVAILEAQQSDWEQERASYSVELASAREALVELQNQKTAPVSNQLQMLSDQPQVKISRYTSFAGKSDWGRDHKLFTTIHEEDWIKDQEPRHYLLQLITLPNEQLVKKFFEMYPLQEAEKAYFVSKKGNKDIYNIVYGVYADRNAALRGLESLPEGIRKKEPLIRDFASIQQYVAGTN